MGVEKAERRKNGKHKRNSWGGKRQKDRKINEKYKRLKKRAGDYSNCFRD